MRSKIKLKNQTLNSAKSDFFSRLDLVAWLIAAQEDNNLLHLNPKSSNLKAAINKYMKDNPEKGHSIQTELTHELLPENKLGWINESHRQSFWLKNYAPMIFNNKSSRTPSNLGIVENKFPHAIPRNLSGKNLNIAIIDYWSIKSFKYSVDLRRYCGELEHEWEKLTESDKFFSWISRNESNEICHCFWDFLSKKYPDMNGSLQTFNSHEEILMFFDNPLIQKDTKELLSQNFRKTWNQRIRRENTKDFKQCNFVLPVKTIAKLENLASKHHLSRTEIIILIINGEAKNETYIRELLNYRKSLLDSPEATQ